MSDSLRYQALADQMLRRATAAASEAERVGYLDLAKAWRTLAQEAAAFEARTRGQEDRSIGPASDSGGERRTS